MTGYLSGSEGTESDYDVPLLDERNTMKAYADFDEKNMQISDYLAYDRTRLALVRTALSMVRTVLGLFASGAGLIILNNELGLIWIGYLLIGIAFFVMVAGTVYYINFRKRLDVLGRK